MKRQEISGETAGMLILLAVIIALALSDFFGAMN